MRGDKKVLLVPASDTDIAVFEKTRCYGPTRSNFLLDLKGKPLSTWNKATARCFVRSFKDTVPGNIDEADIERRFLTHVRHLMKVFKDDNRTESSPDAYEVEKRAELDRKASEKRQQDTSVQFALSCVPPDLILCSYGSIVFVALSDILVQ